MTGRTYRIQNRQGRSLAFDRLRQRSDKLYLAFDKLRQRTGSQNRQGRSLAFDKLRQRSDKLYLAFDKLRQRIDRLSSGSEKGQCARCAQPCF